MILSVIRDSNPIVHYSQCLLVPVNNKGLEDVILKNKIKDKYPDSMFMLEALLENNALRSGEILYTSSIQKGIKHIVFMCINDTDNYMTDRLMAFSRLKTLLQKKVIESVSIALFKVESFIAFEIHRKSITDTFKDTNLKINLFQFHIWNPAE